MKRLAPMTDMNINASIANRERIALPPVKSSTVGSCSNYGPDQFADQSLTGYQLSAIGYRVSGDGVMAGHEVL